MLEIKITDLGAMHTSDKMMAAISLALALDAESFTEFLHVLNALSAAKTKAKPESVLMRELGGAHAAVIEELKPEDNPATGAPTQEESDLAEAAAAFAQHNTPPVPHAPEVAQTMPVPEVPTTSPTLLDSRGLPWDARIHAGTRAQNADGSWKALRGVDKALVPAVEAELRARSNGAVPAPDLPPAGTFAAAPPMPQPPAGPGMTYQQVAAQVMADMAAMKVTNDMLVQACAKTGIKAFPELVTRPELVGIFHTALYGAAS